MITHCPSCRTHFRVHADQLAARAGQVRCGKCNRVFDALEFLIEESAPAPLPASQADYDLAVPPGEPLLEPVTQGAPQFDVELPPPAKTASFEEDLAEPDNGASAEEAVEPESAASSDEADEQAHAETSFDFGPIAAAEEARQTRRWPWLLGILLLLLMLAAQAAYFYRSALIVLFPDVKPYATALCAKLGCELPLPRRIEQISIEASDLQADTANPNIMVLSATLRNRAIFDQQLPSLELTLTDAQDRPVVRRVLAPADYMSAPAGKDMEFAANSEIAIKVFIESSQVKATGYRLYLFYP